MMRTEIARTENLDGILQLEKQCFSVFWTEGQLLSEIESEYGCIFLCVEEEKLRGYAIMHLAGDQAELYRIATDPDFRRCGAAALLMKSCIKWSVEQNAESIFLEVREGNKSAISLYEKFGFENIGIRKKYYTDPVENAVIMVRKVTEDDNSCS